MNQTIVIAIIILTGYIFGHIATKFKFPKVTGFIIAGILLNPNLTKIIPENFIEHTNFITNISLSFITFSVGGTLLFKKIKTLGKSIIAITIFESEFAFLAVCLIFISISMFLLDNLNITWLSGIVPLSLLLASLATPTDPSATLAVSHEYQAKGVVTSTIMGVAAFDDVMGILNYSFAIVIASVFAAGMKFSIFSSLIMPFIIIISSILLGILFGIIFNLIVKFIKKESEGALIVLILGLLGLCFGIANLFNLDELLSTMVMGIIVVNFNIHGNKIFKIIERYTEELIFVLFFTISGMLLNFSVLFHSYLLIIVFVISRAIGKISGTMIGTQISNSSLPVKKYTSLGLIPQGGIVIGLALMMKANPDFDHISDIIINIIIGATVIHEIIGPILAKYSLKKAGEINLDE